MVVPGTDLPRLIGERYVLEACIGRGGMAEVWRARHLVLGSLFAIKLLHGAIASEERSRKRFLKEAQLTAQLKTRYAVQVFDYGVAEGGIPYLVMDLLDGEALDQRIARVGPLQPADAVRILRLAARALDRAHEIGVIHRDFKPENVFLLEDEEGVETVKVVDFGIAKFVGELETDNLVPGAPPKGEEALWTVARMATLIGTPCYMAPEQIHASPDLGPETDLWALGVVAFECLTGHRPFDADDLRDLLTSIERSDHPRASELVPDLPPAFDAWFDKACAAEPADRFESGYVAIVALASCLGVAIESEPPVAYEALASVRGRGSISDPPAADVTPVSTTRSTPPKGIELGELAPSARACVVGARVRRHPHLVRGLIGGGTVFAIALASFAGVRRTTPAPNPETAPALAGVPTWVPAPEPRTAPAPEPQTAPAPEPQASLPATETAPEARRPSARAEAGDAKRSASQQPGTRRAKAAMPTTPASAQPAVSMGREPAAPLEATEADPGSAYKLAPLGL